MLSVLIGVMFFLIGLWLGLPFWLNLIFAIGIIVANVPEGLLPTVTLALAMASQRMAKRNVLGAPSACSGNTGLDHGDLHRQNRNADAKTA